MLAFQALWAKAVRSRSQKHCFRFYSDEGDEEDEEDPFKKGSYENLERLQNLFHETVSCLTDRNYGLKIAVCLRRQPKELIPVISSLLHGHLLIPLDWRSKPTASVALIQSCSGVDVLVCEEEHQEKFRELLPNNLAILSISLNGKRDDLNFHSVFGSLQASENERKDSQVISDRSASLEGTAYILHTSGSTGAPKGVLGAYSGLLNRLEWGWRTFPFATAAPARPPPSSSSEAGAGKEEAPAAAAAGEGRGAEEEEEEGETVLRRTPLVFVDALPEILGAIFQCIPLLYPKEADMDDPRWLGARVLSGATPATRATLVPSLLAPALRHAAAAAAAAEGAGGGPGGGPGGDQGGGGGGRGGLRYLFVSGEALGAGLVRAAAARVPGCELVNLYGSTEVAGDVTYATLHQLLEASQRSGDEFSFIGSPINGAELTVFDEHGNTIQENEIGRAGFLVIDGITVANGYYDGNMKSSLLEQITRDDPAAGQDPASSTCSPTCQCPPAGEAGFACAPCRARGVRRFRTGDLVAWDGGGGLFYVGRRDRQVKIRGVRLALDGLEANIKSAILLNKATRGIKDVALLVVHNRNHDQVEQKNSDDFVLKPLKPSLVLLTGGKGNSRDIKQLLAGCLPYHSVPSAVVVYSSLPKTGSGKIDRLRCLKIIQDDGSYSEALAQEEASKALGNTVCQDQPDLYVKMKLLEVFRKILGFQFFCGLENSQSMEVLFEKSFYDLGGYSLASIEVIEELKLAGIEGVDPHNLQLKINELAPMLLHPAENITTTAMPLPGKVLQINRPLLSKRKRRKDTEPANQSSMRTRRSSLLGETTKIYRRGGVTTWKLNAHFSRDSLSHSSLTFKKMWSVPMEKCVDGSPIGIKGPVTGGDNWVMAGSHSGKFCCINACTGIEIWTINLGERIEATPHIHNGCVLIGCYDGCLYSVSIANGQVNWKFSTQDIIKSTAITVDLPETRKHDDGRAQQQIVFGSYDTYVYGLAADSGTQLWRFKCSGPIYGTPACFSSFAGGQAVTIIVVPCLSGFMHAISVPRGKEISSYENDSDNRPESDTTAAANCKGGSICEIWSTRLPAPIFSSPVVAVDGSLLVVGCADGSVYGINSMNGEHLWKQNCSSSDPIFSSPCLFIDDMEHDQSAPLRIVIGTHDQDSSSLVLLDVFSGNILEKFCLRSGVFSVPFVLHLISCTSEGTRGGEKLEITEKFKKLRPIAFVTTIKHNVFALELCAADGVAHQVDSTKQPEPSIPNISGELYSSPIVMDSKVILGTRADALHCYSFDVPLEDS